MQIITRNIPELSAADTERFWSRVEKLEPDDCWPWIPVKGTKKYGRLRIKNTIVRAHRVSYLLRYGSIPDTLLVCHSCDNPTCQNPNHLWAGTNTENSHDRDRKGRHVPIRGDKNGARLYPERMSRRGNFVRGLLGRFTAIAIFCCFAGLSHSQSQSATPDVSDIQNVRLDANRSGYIAVGQIKAARDHYDKAAIDKALAAKLTTQDELTVAKTLYVLKDMGVNDLPKPILDKQTTRIAKFTQAKEVALLKVMKKDPARAKAKKDELVAAGIPISEATQKAVEAAQPKAKSTPTPAANPSASDDGL